jgi:hypothetical protein
MAEGGTRAFSNSGTYAAAFGDARVNLTITGAGDFKARLTRLKWNQFEVYRCWENLPRIAYISLPADCIFISFPMGRTSLVSDGFTLRNGDMVLHSQGERFYQRSNGACQWGLMSLSPEQLAGCSTALIRRSIAPTQTNKILCPTRADLLRFRRLFEQACDLAESKGKLIEHPEVARALEQEMLHAIVNCLAANERDDKLGFKKR